MTALNFDERNAIATLRKSMVRKPEIVRELFKGMAKEVITHALLQAKDEMATLLAVNQAVQAAAREFIIRTRDGHPAGLLWASTRYAALNRAVSLAGAGATAEHT